MYTLARHIAGYRWVIRFARNFVDFIDVNNANLGLFNIVIALLQQFLDNILDVFTNISCFGECRGVCYGERHIQEASQGFSEQSLAAASRANQQDVTLAEFNILPTLAVTQTFVMVIDSDSQNFFRALLTDDIVVEDIFDFVRYRQMILLGAAAIFLHLFTDDIVAKINTFIANKYRWPSNQFADFVLALATEGAVQQLAAIVTHFSGFVAHPAILRH